MTKDYYNQFVWSVFPERLPFKLVNKMKLTCLSLCLSIGLTYASSSYAQSTSISLQITNQTVADVLERIENQSEFNFFYNGKLVDVGRKVSINTQDKDVYVVLDQIFESTNVAYKVVDKDIILTTVTAHNKTLANTIAENKKIIGKIVDMYNEPIIGANIIIQGTSNGTISDIDGNFILNASKGDILNISYVGYLSQRLTIKDKSNLSVILKEDLQLMDEVVVVGYGVQKKVNLTGSVSVVDMKKTLGDRPVTNVGAALQGTIPGLVISGGSVPGQGKSFNIRGVTSINGGSPLILVDNVPAQIDLINPEDIESVSVLKDAASAAIYGARGAFGVVLITTKKAKKNSRLQLNYNNNFGFAKAVNRPEQASVLDILETHLAWDNDGQYFAEGQNLSDWIGYVKDYNSNPSAYPSSGRYIPEGEQKYYYLKDTDPQGAILDNYGFQQTHNISASGGSEKITYRMSLGYTDNEGILITNKDNYERLSVSSYISADITSWLNQSVDIRYARGNRSYVESDGAIYRTAFAAFYPEGSMPLSSDIDGPEYLVNTPANYLLQKDPVKYTDENPRIFSRTSIKPLDGLEAVLEYTFDKNNRNKKYYSSPFQMTNTQMGLLYSDNPSSGRYRQDKSETNYSALNVFATYSKSIKDTHNFKLMTGYSQESRKWETLYVLRDDLINPDMPSISGATGEIQTGDGYKEYSIRSGFFRLNYDYLGKYLLELNGRYDGSSKFPTTNRFGFFPSFSAGWRVGEEQWMEWSREWLDDFKLRGSWGQVGNQAIAEYAFTPIMSTKQSDWIQNNKRPMTLNSPGLVRSDFTWEIVETLDLGFDFAAFNSRLTSTFAWYQRDTKGMLMPGAEFPSIVGTSAPKQNAADLRTQGWELAFTWRDHIGDWGYNVGFNIFDAESKITKYENNAGLFYDRNSAQNAKRYREGMALGEIWGYTTDRYYTIADFQDGWQDGNWKLKDGITTIKGNSNIRPGDIMYKNIRDDEEQGSVNQIDGGRDNVDDPGDKTVIGNETARYQYGASLGVSWKGIDLSIFLHGTGKRDAWLGGDLRFPLSYGSFGTVYSHQLDFWKPMDPENGNWNAMNPNAEFPRLYDEGKNAGSNNRIQTKYLVDASYLRLKNVTVGYTIPANIIKKSTFTNAKIFFSAENLFTWDKLPKGYDPERLSWGYPFYCTYSFGINLTL